MDGAAFAPIKAGAMRSFSNRSSCFLLFLASCCAVEAQPARVEMNSLKTQYENAVDRETAPLRDKYLAALKALREKYTKVGDLDSALIIDKELKAESASLIGVVKKLPADDKEMRDFMKGSVWTLMSDPKSRLEFREDGSIFDGKKIIAHYQVTERRKLVMYWGGGIGKGPLECLISEDCLAIAEQSGYRAVYTRAQ